MSQEELADAADLHRSAVSFIERGQRSSKLQTIEKLARGLSLQPAELMPPLRTRRWPAAPSPHSGSLSKKLSPGLLQQLVHPLMSGGDRVWRIASMNCEPSPEGTLSQALAHPWPIWQALHRACVGLSMLIQGRFDRRHSSRFLLRATAKSLKFLGTSASLAYDRDCAAPGCGPSTVPADLNDPHARGPEMSETALITPPLQTLIDNLDRAAESPSRRALFAQMTAAALGVMFAGGAARRAFAGPRPVGDIIVVSLENHTVTVYPIEGEDPRIGLDVAPIDDPDNPIYSSTHSGTLTDPMILQIEALADLANDLHPGHVHRFNAMLASFGLSELAVPTAIGGGPPSGGETEGGAGYAGGFVLILVLFILLVIIGAGFGLGYGGYSDE